MHIWSFLSIYIYIRCTSLIFIHTCDKYNTATVLPQELLVPMQWIFAKGASSACLSLSSNAQACQRRDWKFESSPKKIWNNTNKVHFKSLHVWSFLRVTYLLKPPLLWTALPSQHAALCFPEHVNPRAAKSHRRGNPQLREGANRLFPRQVLKLNQIQTDFYKLIVMQFWVVKMVLHQIVDRKWCSSDQITSSISVHFWMWHLHLTKSLFSSFGL